MEKVPDIWNMPAGVPPPGVVPNFINPEIRVPMIDVSAAVCLPLIIMFAGSRLYAKAFIVQRRSWDDVVHLGAYGRHKWDYRIGDLSVELIRLTLANEVLYGPFVWFIKTTLFLLYLEIFGQLRWMRWLGYFGICTTGLFYHATAVAYLVLCAPKGQTHLDLLTAITSAKCQKQSQTVSMVVGSFNLASDLYILFLPLPAIWSLQMPRQRKIGISAIFSSGIAAVISSILSIVLRTRLSKSNDNIWDIIPLWIVTIVEITAGYMVTCMPSMAAVYRHAHPKLQQALSATLRKVKSHNSSRETKESRNDSQVELHPVKYDPATTR